MKKSPIIADLFWLGLGTAVVIESWRLKFGTWNHPGPGFLPFLAGCLLGLLAIASILQRLKGEKEEADTPWVGVSFAKLGLIVGVLFIYVAVLDVLGFIIATFLLLLFLFRVVEPYRWTTVLLCSFITLGAIYFFFVYLLNTRLPQGWLGF